MCKVACNLAVTKHACSLMGTCPKTSMHGFTSPHVHGAGDYRDQLPPSIREVAEQYAPVVVKGRRTHGLFDCWAPKIRPLKAAVHIPCW